MGAERREKIRRRLTVQGSVDFRVQFGDPFLNRLQFLGQHLGPTPQIGKFLFWGRIRPGSRDIPPHGRTIAGELILAPPLVIPPISVAPEPAAPRSHPVETWHIQILREYGVIDSCLGRNPARSPQSSLSHFCVEHIIISIGPLCQRKNDVLLLHSLSPRSYNLRLQSSNVSVPAGIFIVSQPILLPDTGKIGYKQYDFIN